MRLILVVFFSLIMRVELPKRLIKIKYGNIFFSIDFFSYYISVVFPGPRLPARTALSGAHTGVPAQPGLGFPAPTGAGCAGEAGPTQAGAVKPKQQFSTRFSAINLIIKELTTDL